MIRIEGNAKNVQIVVGLIWPYLGCWPDIRPLCWGRGDTLLEKCDSS